MNQAVVFRIYLARQALQEAVQHTSDPLPFTRMRLIWALDNAIELLLCTLLPEMGVRVERNWSLQKMMEELAGKKSLLQSHRTPIERLRRLRDRVQHDGIIPSPEDVRQAAVQAESFIRDAVREVLGKELEKVSPAELIQDEKAREHLLEAEKSLQNNDYRLAVREAAVAFDLGWTSFRLHSSPRWRRHLGEELVNEIANAAKNAARAGSQEIKMFARKFAEELERSHVRQKLEELIEPLELARYGVDMSIYTRFKQVTPRVYWTFGREEPHIFEPNDWAPSKLDAMFAIDFACTALLQLQAWFGKEGCEKQK